MTVKIPKKLGHIWIGGGPPPLEWMQTWRDHHPDWDYTLYDNAYLTGRHWRFQPLITAFFRRGDFPGVSDLMRYEILYEQGGFLPEADSLCLKPTDELWNQPSLYSVWENEETRPGNITPFLASAPQHPYLRHVIRWLRRRRSPDDLRVAHKSVGNTFLGRLYEKVQPENVVLYPSRYFNPTHARQRKRGVSGDMSDAYADQMWGSTTHCYPAKDPEQAEKIETEVLARLEARLA